MKLLPPEKAVDYADSLAKKNVEALSFLPRPRLLEYAVRGQLLIETENGEPCGFMVYGNGWPYLKVYQVAIEYDARRREHGLALVARLIERAKERGCHAISLWCADDLEANAFWESAGFHFAGQREGGRRRGRKHNRWTMVVDSAPLSLWGVA
jgi:ribosomal protein S18 acetylase RimI-like enzyme